MVTYYHLFNVTRPNPDPVYESIKNILDQHNLKYFIGITKDDKNIILEIYLKDGEKIPTEVQEFLENLDGVTSKGSGYINRF